MLKALLRQWFHCTLEWDDFFSVTGWDFGNIISVNYNNSLIWRVRPFFRGLFPQILTIIYFRGWFPYKNHHLWVSVATWGRMNRSDEPWFSGGSRGLLGKGIWWIRINFSANRRFDTTLNLDKLSTTPAIWMEFINMLDKLQTHEVMRIHQ